MDLALCQNQLTIDIQGYFWALDSIPLVYMPNLMPVAHCFDYYRFVVNFGVGKYELSNVAPLFQDCFGYSGLFI